MCVLNIPGFIWINHAFFSVQRVKNGHFKFNASYCPHKNVEIQICTGFYTCALFSFAYKYVFKTIQNVRIHILTDYLNLINVLITF